MLRMHPLFERADRLSREVIAAAIEVHRDKGPGLVESIYEWALGCELTLRGISFEVQQTIPITYKGFIREEPLRLDLFVEQSLLVETKAVTTVLPIHKAQLLTYMRLLSVSLGLVVNFNEGRLVDGIHRVMLPGANRPDSGPDGRT